MILNRSGYPEMLLEITIRKDDILKFNIKRGKSSVFMSYFWIGKTAFLTQNRWFISFPEG